MSQQRSWWGWGTTDAAATDGEVEELAGRLHDTLGVEPGAPLEPPPADAVDLPAVRVAVPEDLGVAASTRPTDRLRHGHGQSFREVAAAVRGSVPTPPDAVARPGDADGVARLLDWCADEGVACVPYGGGTSVVGGVTPPPVPTVSLDLGRLDRLIQVDPRARLARLGAGATGPAVEEHLRPHGLTLRHFPQSWEFSTVGGWVATRAGGHYATGWTHIDDFVASIGAETPAGRYDSRPLPGSGAGPSPDRLLLGSEGTLGVITDAWLRVQRRPVHRGRATVLFPDLAAGTAAVRALAQSGLGPANCRLLDAGEALVAGAGDGRHAVLVLGFESADHALGPWLDRALELCRDHAGRPDGEPELTSGDETGTTDGAGGAWRDTFLRAPYLRDALVRLGMIVETFETAVPWTELDDFVATVGAAARGAAEELCGTAVVTTRITHAYPDGAAPYFTVIAPGDPDDPGAQWDEIKAAASEAILAGGGTITHHHAVGRDHVPWYERQRPRPFGAALAAAKERLDPAGICNPGVLGLSGIGSGA